MLRNQIMAHTYKQIVWNSCIEIFHMIIEAHMEISYDYQEKANKILYKRLAKR